MKDIFSTERVFRIVKLGNILKPHKNWKSPQRGEIFSPYGIAPTCDTCGGGGRETKIFVEL